MCVREGYTGADGICCNMALNDLMGIFKYLVMLADSGFNMS